MKNQLSAQCLIASLILLTSGYTEFKATAQDDASPKSAKAGTGRVSTLPAPNTLLDGTPVRLRLQRNLLSGDAHVGDQVDFDVLEEVKVGEMIAIPKGAIALATITTAEHKKSMGRAGKLNVNIDSVRLADLEKAPLRATQGGKGRGHVAVMTTAMVASGILFFPAAPLFLFIHGRDMVIPKGTEITAYVNGDMHLDPANFHSGEGVTGSVSAITSSPSTLLVDAAVAGCDSEVDRKFVDNTPSEVSVAAGKHEVEVKKKGYHVWTKTVMVSGSSTHLMAELEAEKPNGLESVPAAAPKQ